MHAPRRLVPWLVTAGLVLAPAGALAQGGAGDDQYSDPFGGSTPSTGAAPARPAPRRPMGPSLTNRPPATPRPAPADGAARASTTTGSGATTSAWSKGSTGSGQVVATSRELPRTGIDAGVVALLGAALLAAGVGLRSRTADGSAG